MTEPGTSTNNDLTIRKSIVAEAPVERAFEVFTAGWPDWWPAETHSIEQGRPEIDWRPGGVAVEIVGADRHEWADVLAYEPSRLFALRWRVNSEQPPTELRVTFTPEGERTRIDVAHSGWEAFGDRAAEVHRSYDTGWADVLPHYERHLAAP